MNCAQSVRLGAGHTQLKTTQLFWHVSRNFFFSLSYLLTNKCMCVNIEYVAIFIENQSQHFIHGGWYVFANNIFLTIFAMRTHQKDASRFIGFSFVTCKSICKTFRSKFETFLHINVKYANSKHMLLLL